MSKNIDKIVNRFLGWKLPKDFAPDGGISFKPSEHPDFWPVGTHLFTADQAKAMFEYCLQGAEQAEQTPVRECDGLLCNDCGEYKQKYKNLPGLTEKDLCICEQAAPVRTKDLTDDEINEVLWRGGPFETVLDATRAVIAAYKEKNNVK